MTQPKALFLADILEDAGKPADVAEKASAELRRLHAENEDLTTANEQFGKRQEWWNEKMFALEAQRDALLEALKQIEPILARMYGPQAAELPPMQIVRATIAKAEENKYE